MAGLLVILGIIGMVIFLAIVRGFVFSVLWGWFVVPFGLPDITIPWAIGIALIVTYLTGTGARAKEEIEEMIGRMIAIPIVTLLIGWVAHSFM